MMTDTAHVPPGIDAEKPTPGRIYDYLLGGSTNFPADRAMAEKILTVLPELRDIVWANRGFHQRVARWIAERGIRQFVDIGSGLPTVGNTHEVVRKVAPDARVVYVDNDPLVAAHARELLTADGAVAVFTCDLREPATVLGHPDLRALIDFTEPIGLLMTAVLHFVADGSDPWGLVARYVSALAPGSYLAISHSTAEKVPPAVVRRVTDAYANATEQMYFRPLADVERFFAGLELVPPYPGAPPGVVHMGQWGADDPELADSDGSRWGYGGVARVTG